MRPFTVVQHAVIASVTLTGATARAVSVEVHVSNGLPGFTIVGLPDAAVASPGTGCVPPFSRAGCRGRCVV